jgi:dihydroxyacid dehydratase/phosphogluconate dehydratase
MGGWSEDYMRKPLIMVAAPYTNASSCNHHFDQLAKHISDAVEEAGGKA